MAAEDFGEGAGWRLTQLQLSTSKIRLQSVLSEEAVYALWGNRLAIRPVLTFMLRPLMVTSPAA